MYSLLVKFTCNLNVYVFNLHKKLENIKVSSCCQRVFIVLEL